MDERSDDRSRREARHLHVALSDRRGGTIIAGMLAAVGAFFVWQGSLLDFGDFALPGPGFFPMFLGAAIVGFAAVIGFDRWRSSASEAVDLGHRDVLIAIVALLAVPLMFEPLGAYITLGLFATAMLVFIARARLLPAIAAAGLGMAACWYFFQQLLGLQLPAGPW
jgi:hypothetical protein